MQAARIPHIVPVSYDVMPRLRLTVCPTDRFKIGTLSIYALLPDSPHIAPTATALLPVLRRGCERYPSQELLNRRLDDLYATDCHTANTVVGNARCIGLISEVAESRFLPDGVQLLPDVIALMAQLLFCPVTERDGALSMRYVESERKKLIDAIESLVSYPAAYAMRRFRTLFAQGKESGAPVTVEQLQALREQDLRELLQVLRHTACFHVFYIGQTPPTQLTDMLRQSFQPYLSINAEQAVWPSFAPQPQSPRTRPLVVNEQSEAGQSHLILGYRTHITLTSPDFYAMMLCNELLGGSPVSRLFRYLREERSLCYSCQSEYSWARGELIVSCGIDRERRRESEEAILSQLAALQRGDFSDEEMEAARSLLVSSYTQLTDSTRALHAYYQARQIVGVQETVETCRAHIQNVTREQLIRAAQSLICDTVYFLEGGGSDALAEEEWEDTDDE